MLFGLGGYPSRGAGWRWSRGDRNCGGGQTGNEKNSGEQRKVTVVGWTRCGAGGENPNRPSHQENQSSTANCVQLESARSIRQHQDWRKKGRSPQEYLTHTPGRGHALHELPPHRACRLRLLGVRPALRNEGYGTRSRGLSHFRWQARAIPASYCRKGLTYASNRLDAGATPESEPA